MFKSCSKCGKIHSFNAKCKVGCESTRDNSQEAKIRNKRSYTKASKYVKENSNYLCAVCLKNGVLNSDNIETHHIEKIKEKPELAYDIDNLICLCKMHHQMAEIGMISKEVLHYIKKHPPGLKQRQIKL